MTHLGPLVARSLMRNIGGHAARSELDRLCEPLKKLVVLRPEAQAWLEQALLEGQACWPGCERVALEDGRAFLRKVIA